MIYRKQHHLHRSIRTGVMLIFCFWLCSWALIGCGSAPHADRPLMTGITASAASATPAAIASVGTRIQPIEVQAAQSNLASYPNGPMDLTIVTSPFAICNFIVNYGLDKVSNSFGIVPVTADAKGIATWHWQVEGKATTGMWPLAITASLVNGSHTTASINVTVNLPPINLVSSKSVLNVLRKTDATLAIVTAPFLPCTVTVNYGGRTRVFQGTADAKGMLTWTWRVEPSAPIGTSPLIVDGTTGSGEHTSTQFALIVG
jgi:hypothetical protein